MSDIDGIDGVFDRAMAKAIREDRKRQRKANVEAAAVTKANRGNWREWCLANVQAAEPMPRVGL